MDTGTPDIFTQCLRRVTDSVFGPNRVAIALNKAMLHSGYAYIDTGAPPDDGSRTFKLAVSFTQPHVDEALLTFCGRDFTAAQFGRLASAVPHDNRFHVIPSSCAVLIEGVPTEGDIAAVMRAWHDALDLERV